MSIDWVVMFVVKRSELSYTGGGAGSRETFDVQSEGKLPQGGGQDGGAGEGRREGKGREGKPRGSETYYATPCLASCPVPSLLSLSPRSSLPPPVQAPLFSSTRFSPYLTSRPFPSVFSLTFPLHSSCLLSSFLFFHYSILSYPFSHPLIHFTYSAIP